MVIVCVMVGSEPIAGRWLVGFRWGAATGTLAVVLVAKLALRARLPLVPVLALIGVEVASNIVLTAVSHHQPRLSSRLVLGMMMADVLLLTGLLHLTGGASNPFSFVYLIYLTVAAISLPVSWTWGLAVLTASSFGTLFLGPPDLHHGPREMSRHLHGMWVAFVVAAFFIVFFVNRLRRELDARQQRLVRAERLAAATTLAAGAAHELSTPLGTIAVAAAELEDALDGRDEPEEELRADVALIRSQVEHCKEILAELHGEAGNLLGEAPRSIDAQALLDPLRKRYSRLELQIDVGCSEALELPVVALRRVLGSLVENAIHASRANESVSLQMRIRGDALELAVSDRGAGMSGELLERACEPFFTTKDAGDGIGLGLFLAQACASQLGGDLAIDSKVGRGTVVTLRLPLLEKTSGAA